VSLVGCGGGGGQQTGDAPANAAGTPGFNEPDARTFEEPAAPAEREESADEAARRVVRADATLARVMLAIGVDDEQRLVEQGLRLYSAMGCVQCHSPDGEADTGPSFAGIWAEPRDMSDAGAVQVHAGYIRTSLIDPDAYVRPGFANLMPTYENQLSPREIIALTAFIRSLDEPEPGPLDMSLAGSSPMTEQGDQLDPLNIFNEPTQDERARAEFERVPEAPDRPGQAGVREDGRPAWWFDGLRREGGRVQLCVEAIAPDLAEARRRAVDLAYERLADRLELDSPDQLDEPLIELATVTPLPNAGGEPRYTGYVLISAKP
jgi:mono/diheme cytochrome c family protein